MSTFSDSNLVKKLAELNSSQQSIQTLSLWLIHHRKHSKTVVEVWFRELQKVKPPKRLTFIYLANDVVQNSKKKGPEFSRDFSTVLKEAFRISSKDVEDKTRQSLQRLCNIWSERHVFEPSLITDINKVLEGEPPAKKKKLVEKIEESLPKAIREEITADIEESPREPPEAEELVRALQELESSASSDAAVRERIAALPPQVSDVSLLEKIQDKQAASKLKEQVEDACVLLADYNTRLQAELEDRRNVAVMLKDFIAAQKDQLAESEKKLEEYKQKLERVSEVRQELKSHIQSLPDLTLLPDITGGLKPLPSAGDLFSG